MLLGYPEADWQDNRDVVAKAIWNVFCTRDPPVRLKSDMVIGTACSRDPKYLAEQKLWYDGVVEVVRTCSILKPWAPIVEGVLRDVKMLTILISVQAGQMSGHMAAVYAMDSLVCHTLRNLTTDPHLVEEPQVIEIADEDGMAGNPVASPADG